MQARAKLAIVILLVLALAIFSFTSLADPTGPTLINGTPERRTTGIDSTTGTPVEAQAGNVTALTINTTRITQRWQGYYGNITGTITLDTADEMTLYSWELANPEGEIYAVNGSATPSWANVECLQFNRSVTNTDLTMLQTNLGMSTTDADNVNNTFNMTFVGSFNIGDTNTINSEDNCSLVSLHVNDNQDQLSFNETILIDDTNDNNLIIYTALLEQDATGFSGSSLDFQMIVGENGETVESTTYYFYAELS